MSFAAALMSATALWLVLSRYRSRGTHRRDGAHKAGAQRFGLDVTTSQFWLSSLGAGALAFGFVLALTGLMAVAVVPAIVVAMLPKAYYERKRSQRLAGVQEAWPDGLRDLLSSVRSGASLPAALEDLGRYGPQSLRDVFGGFSVYARSLGVVPTLEMIRGDLADPTSDRVIEVLILAYERGGSAVPDILQDLAVATTKDVWALEQVRGEALEQKINSRVVFALPWLVLVVMTMRSGAFREFYSTATGMAVIAICGLLSLAGMAMAVRIGAQPEEPRVFAGGAD